MKKGSIYFRLRPRAISAVQCFSTCGRNTRSIRCDNASPVAASFHLQRYVDEECTRFNDRKDDDAGRFAAVMSRVNGRRLTWRFLTAQDGAGFMGLQ